MSTHCAVAINPNTPILARGERPKCFGATVVVAWPLEERARAQYEAFAAEARTILPDACYVYPGAYLHCTVATLVSFTSGMFKERDAEAEAHAVAWVGALQDHLAPELARIPPFELTFVEPVATPGAGIFRIESPEGTIGAMRSAIARAAQDERVQALRPSLAGTQFHIPDIQHSTFCRYVSQPAGGLEDVEGAFEKLRAIWRPLRVRISEARVAYETSPYMHVDDHSSSTAAVFPLGGEDAVTVAVDAGR